MPEQHLLLQHQANLINNKILMFAQPPPTLGVHDFDKFFINEINISTNPNPNPNLTPGGLVHERNRGFEAGGLGYAVSHGVAQR